MRSSTPDALDGKAKEGECQTKAEPGHGGGVRPVPLKCMHVCITCTVPLFVLKRS